MPKTAENNYESIRSEDVLFEPRRT